MAALGLTDGQFAIAANVYKLKFSFTPGRLQRWLLQIPVPRSTSIPTKVLGYQANPVEGQIEVLGSAIHATEADILGSDDERKISWVEGGIEVYRYAKGGTVTHCRPKFGLLVAATDLYLVGFSFALTDTKLYRAADDEPLGGT